MPPCGTKVTDPVRDVFLRCLIFVTITLHSGALCELFAQDTTSTKVKPLAGEGIYALLVRNGLDPRKDLTAFMELNSGKFGKDNSLLSHHAYELPPVVMKPTTVIEPLFGEALQEFPLTTNTLSGSLFYLISGHGGPDPGASGIYGTDRLDEDEYAYDITLRLGRSLLSKGARVIFVIQDPDDGICDDKFLKYDNDETCMGDAIPLKQNDRLKQRVDKVNQLYQQNKHIAHQRSVSIHLDSRSEKKQIDVFFYHHQTSPRGLSLAQTLRQTMEDKYHLFQPGRGFSGTVTTRNLYEVKYTHPVAVFIELGNIQIYRDQQRFILSTNRQALADWLAEGLEKDFVNQTNMGGK